MKGKIISILFVFVFLGMSFVSAVNSQINMPSVKIYPNGSTTLVQTQPQYSQIQNWNTQQLCYFTKGCLKDTHCYPLGYIENGTYCGDYLISGAIQRSKFFPQLNQSQTCIYDFQCKSNFCFNSKCVENINSLLEELNSKVSGLNSTISTYNNSFELVKNRLLVLENLEESSENESVSSRQKTTFLGMIFFLFGH